MGAPDRELSGRPVLLPPVFRKEPARNGRGNALHARDLPQLRNRPDHRHPGLRLRPLQRLRSQCTPDSSSEGQSDSVAKKAFKINEVINISKDKTFEMILLIIGALILLIVGYKRKKTFL